MSDYGRKVTAGDVDMGTIGTQQQRAGVYGPMPENGWVTKLGFWGGKATGTNVNTRLALWATNNNNPAALKGDTAAFSVSTTMSHGGSGQAYEANIINRQGDPYPGSVQVYAGQSYSIGIVAINATLNHGMIAASKITAPNENFYYRNGVTAPTDPNGYTSATNEGVIDAWAVYQPNRQPTSVPSWPYGLQTSTTLTFEGVHSDDDLAIGDRLTAFQFQIKLADTGALIYDSNQLVPTSDEVTNNKFSRPIDGFNPGVEYHWRCRTRDAFNTWSEWSGWWAFAVNTGGSVDTFSGVTGLQTTQQPTPFSARWRHGSLNANRLQVRILQNGVPIKTGSELTIDVAPNGILSTTWASSFSSYAIPWGSRNLTWEMKARDTGGLWTDWTQGGSFHVNSAPSIPTNLTPSNSAASGTRPKLRCYVSDIDGQTPTVKARIKNSAGTVIQTRTMTHVGSGWYEYQTVSGDLASYNTFIWDAYSFDGTLYSGTQTVESNAQKSAEATFIYANAPSVVVTAPTANATLAGVLNLTWNAVPNQTKARAIVYRSDGSVLFDYLDNWTNPYYTFDASWGFRKGQAYSVVVEITNASDLTGSSSPIPFTIDYPAPSPISDFMASPEYQRFDTRPTAVRLTWNAYANPDFERYTLTRITNGVSQRIARITTASQGSFVDIVPPTEADIEYAIVVTTVQGLDETDSAPMYAQTQIWTDAIVLQNVIDVGQRVVLPYDESRTFTHVNDAVYEIPWGSSAPLPIYGTTEYQKIALTVQIIGDGIASAKDYLDALRSLWKSKQTICYRDPRGRRMFGHITSFRETDLSVDRYTVSIEFTQTAFREG